MGWSAWSRPLAGNDGFRAAVSWFSEAGGPLHASLRVLTLILSRSKESIANGWNFWNPVARGLMRLVGHGLGRIGSGENRHHQSAAGCAGVGRNQEGVKR